MNENYLEVSVASIRLLQSLITLFRCIKFIFWVYIVHFMLKSFIMSFYNNNNNTCNDNNNSNNNNKKKKKKKKEEKKKKK